jgi:hypothetical protein
MFSDRRSRPDRRHHHDPAAIPASGDRRRGDRRSRSRRYHSPWWLQAGYVEELDPPLLERPGDDQPD